MRSGKSLFLLLTGMILVLFCSSWGFLVHRTVNQLAIYQLPKSMGAFFWKNKDYLVKESVRPDQRRNSDPSEAPRHFIDLEAYGDSAAWKMPLHLDEAIRQYSRDTIYKYGYVPYVVVQVKENLTRAFRDGNRDSILYYAADLGHYIGDANVPLHSSINYDGQLTGQRGLHALWESTVPDQDLNSYRLRDGHHARYLSDPATAIWEAVRRGHSLLEDLFLQEKEASKGMPDSVKYRQMTAKNGKTYKAYSPAFAKAYGARLGTMVNDQLLRSADLIADFWYTAWVDGGKPDLNGLLTAPFSAQDKKDQRAEYKAYKKNRLIEKGLLLSRLQDGSE